MGVSSMKKSYMIVFVLLCAFLATFFGLVLAKYVEKQEILGSVNVSAELGTISLYEHEAKRQADGSYAFTDKVVSGNEYVLMPGVDVVKDPYVIVDKNSDLLPVYVYVKVKSNLEDSITFEVDSNNWQVITEYNTLAYDVGVYVYTGGTGEALAVTGDLDKIYILDKNKITVGRKLLSSGVNSDQLIFTAAMFQVSSGTDAVDVYNKNWGNIANE